MKKYNFHFCFSKNKKAQILKTKILKKYKNYNIKYSDIIIVLGGDGFMLSSIRKYYKYKKPFFGVNCGNYGFLLNKFNSYNFEKEVLKSNKVTIHPLIASIKTDNIINNRKKLIAINEFSFLRQTKQTSCLSIKKNNQLLIKKLIGDGLIISTPIGSTAYNYSAGGKILKLNSKKLSVVPVNPFRSPFRGSKIFKDNSVFIIKNIRPTRPISISADNLEVRNLLRARIELNNKIKIFIYFKSKNKF